MCGIAGIVYTYGSRESAIAVVRRMIRLQRHRGPDGEGFYDTAGASLGHCRLAIIDLSHTGHQPMSDPQGRYWITYNGEIYNYLELAAELRNLGYRFRSQSDTEVLLAAYREWDQGCLERLRGMFAFAIWDEEKQCLFAARDRVGIKPFHYCTDGQGRLAFASELKALLEFLPERRVNLRLAREFLAWNMLEHEAAETMIAGIKRLPAAHCMTWRRSGEITLQRYWNIEYSEELESPPSQRETLFQEFRQRFEEAVSLHLRSDVPVGTCLSGGLDSSSIMCVVSAELRRREAWHEGGQHAFSACFDDPRLDERPYIEAVATSTDCVRHFDFPSGVQLGEDLDTWLWHQEEPVGGCGVYSQYCVARLAHEHGIRVLLDGQGADEQLAGYRKFILVYLRQLIGARRYVRACWEAIAFFSSPEILRTTSFADGWRYLVTSLPDFALLWPDNLMPERPAALALGDSLGRRLHADLTQFSLPVLLRYEDRNTMAFGVEARVPFLDHLLVEWLATLPADMRLYDGWTKRILRDSLADILPERVRKRRSKLGFSTPESDWLSGPLASWLKETLTAPHYLPEVVDLDGLQQLVARRVRGERSAILEKTLLRLAFYECWARQFLGCVPGISVERTGFVLP